MKNAKELTDKLLTELSNRGGFDDWWYNIDEDTQQEIKKDLINVIKEHK